MTHTILITGINGSSASKYCIRLIEDTFVEDFDQTIEEIYEIKGEFFVD